MTPCPLVVIGGSAGALEPLRALVAGLPHALPAAVLVTLHCSPDSPGHLADILNTSGPLPAQFAQSGALLHPGQIYVAPPDHHLLATPDAVRLSHGPKENRSRPSIDVLFRSAAYTHGSQVIGVLLSGMLDDGTSGLWTIKRLGGKAVVQHPEEALYPSMPLQAAQRVDVDAILPVHQIAPRIQTMLSRFAIEQATPREQAMNESEWQRLALEVEIASGANAFANGIQNQGSFSAFTCPECHGAMIKLQEGQHIRFRCHTGHAYSLQTLLSSLNEAVEVTLWNTVRTLEEKVMLLEHLAKHLEEGDPSERATQYRQEIQATQTRLQMIRQHLTEHTEVPGSPNEALSTRGAPLDPAR